MRLRLTVFIFTLIITALFSSYDITLSEANDSQTMKFLDGSVYQNRRTALREILEPIDAISILKAYVEDENVYSQNSLNKEFEYLTGLNAYDNKKQVSGTILILSYRASFILLNASDNNTFNHLKNWVVKNSGFSKNQVLMFDDNVIASLKYYYSHESLVLLQQLESNGKRVFRNKELVQWSQKFVGTPIYPDALEFNPDYLVAKIARYKNAVEKAKLEKAAKIVEQALLNVAQFMPKTYPAGENSLFIDNMLLLEIKSKIMQLAMGITATPLFSKENNKLEGYLIEKLPKDPLFNKLHIFEQDIIVSVNGKTPNFSSELQSLLTDLSNQGGTLTIEIKRNGKLLKQQYNVVSPNSVGAVEVELLKKLFADTAKKLGATGLSPLKIYEIKNGKYAEITDVVKLEHSIILSVGAAVNGYVAKAIKTINIHDEKYKIAEIEEIVAKSAMRTRGLLEKNTPFARIKSEIMEEFKVSVDFTHAGIFSSSIFPEELVTDKQCVYQIRLSLGNYIFEINSFVLMNAGKDAKEFLNKNIRNFRTDNEKIYEEFRDAGLDITPILHTSANMPDGKMIAAKVKNLSVGIFMTMPFQVGDLILEINGTRVFDCVANGILLDFKKGNVKPFVATIVRGGKTLVITTNSSFFKGFKLNTLCGATERDFFTYTGKLDEKNYRNRTPMSVQAGLTASYICDILSKNGFKPLPNLGKDNTDYFLRSANELEKTDIAGILRNRHPLIEPSLLLKISVPYDFSKDKDAVTPENVDKQVALGILVSQMLAANQDVDILLHFYSQVKKPLSLDTETSLALIDKYKNVVAVSFAFNDNVQNVEVEYDSEVFFKFIAEEFKLSIGLFGLDKLSAKLVKNIQTDSLEKYMSLKIGRLRFVIPAKSDVALNSLKTARMVALIPTIYSNVQEIERTRQMRISQEFADLQKLAETVKEGEDAKAKEIIGEIEEFVKKNPEYKDRFTQNMKDLTGIIERSKAERERLEKIKKRREMLLKSGLAVKEDEDKIAKKLTTDIEIFIEANPAEKPHFVKVLAHLEAVIKKAKDERARLGKIKERREELLGLCEKVKEGDEEAAKKLIDEIFAFIKENPAEKKHFTKALEKLAAIINRAEEERAEIAKIKKILEELIRLGKESKDEEQARKIRARIMTFIEKYPKGKEQLAETVIRLDKTIKGAEDERARLAKIIERREELLASSAKVNDEDAAKKLIAEIETFIKENPGEKESFAKALEKLNEIIKLAEAERAKIQALKDNLLKEYSELKDDDLNKLKDLTEKIELFIKNYPTEKKNFEKLLEDLNARIQKVEDEQEHLAQLAIIDSWYEGKVENFAADEYLFGIGKALFTTNKNSEESQKNAIEKAKYDFRKHFKDMDKALKLARDEHSRLDWLVRSHVKVKYDVAETVEMLTLDTKIIGKAWDTKKKTVYVLITLSKIEIADALAEQLSEIHNNLAKAIEQIETLQQEDKHLSAAKHIILVFQLHQDYKIKSAELKLVAPADYEVAESPEIKLDELIEEFKKLKPNLSLLIKAEAKYKDVQGEITEKANDVGAYDISSKVRDTEKLLSTKMLSTKLRDASISDMLTWQSEDWKREAPETKYAVLVQIDIEIVESADSNGKKTFDAHGRYKFDIVDIATGKIVLTKVSSDEDFEKSAGTDKTESSVTNICRKNLAELITLEILTIFK